MAPFLEYPRFRRLRFKRNETTKLVIDPLNLDLRLSSKGTTEPIPALAGAGWAVCPRKKSPSAERGKLIRAVRADRFLFMFSFEGVSGVSMEEFKS